MNKIVAIKSIKFAILIFFFGLTSVSSSTIKLGVDVFLEGYADIVSGKRVGLITNQTGKDGRGKPTIDLLYEHPQINLVALFAPEHGIRGVKQAGELIKESTDTKTGLPIHSLYGGNDKRPSDVALSGIDVIIYDIQDVGSRAYTYIWSMAEAMAAAGDKDILFIVFDRPNPLSARQIDGPVTEDAWQSFLGIWPIPRVYGLTVGELARYFNHEHYLQCRLIIIPMASYRRDQSWDELKLVWTPPSPNIPTPESAICFPATGTIGALGVIHIGIATQFPFQIIGAPWFAAQHAANYLNNCQLPGIIFEPFSFTPSGGLFRGKIIEAIKLNVQKTKDFLPTTTETYILHYLQKFYSGKFRWNQDRIQSFDKAMGTSHIRQDIINGMPVQQIIAKWQNDLQEFRKKSARYLIYK